MSWVKNLWPWRRREPMIKDMDVGISHPICDCFTEGEKVWLAPTTEKGRHPLEAWITLRPNTGEAILVIECRLCRSRIERPFNLIPKVVSLGGKDLACPKGKNGKPALVAMDGGDEKDDA